MDLSAPLYLLKRRARLLSRREGIPLHKALGRIAAEQGFASWSLLAARAAASTPAVRLLARIEPGDMVLIGARPGQGKTLMALELAAEAAKSGRRGAFFTLEYTQRDVLERLRALRIEPVDLEGRFELDASDALDAGHLSRSLEKMQPGTLAVIDYLQLLDQKRENPPLQDQIVALKTLAHRKGLILVFISQIDRSYDPAAKPLPDMRDIRLPNPLDLSLFTKACFLHAGRMRFHAVSR